MGLGRHEKNLVVSEPTDYRGEFLICSAPGIDFAAMTTRDIEPGWIFNCALGFAKITDSREMRQEDEFDAHQFYLKGAFSWIVSDVQRLAKPFAVEREKFEPGFFDIELKEDLEIIL